MAQELDKDTLEWVAEQEKQMEVGTDILRKASDEALEYIEDALQNLNDRQWRKMVMETQIVEQGIGVGLAEGLIPEVYEDMKKTMHKKLKIPKHTAQALRHIYIGRVVKNVRRALNERDK